METWSRNGYTDCLSCGHVCVQRRRICGVKAFVAQVFGADVGHGTAVSLWWLRPRSSTRRLRPWPNSSAAVKRTAVPLLLQWFTAINVHFAVASCLLFMLLLPSVKSVHLPGRDRYLSQENTISAVGLTFLSAFHRVLACSESCLLWTWFIGILLVWHTDWFRDALWKIF